MNRLLFIILAVPMFTGCGSKLYFNPKDLPDGHFNKSYNALVSITGGTGPVVDLTYCFYPLNSGLTIRFLEEKYYTEHIYNGFIIEGVPVVKGEISLHLRGGIVASAGKGFEKTYKITILK